MAKFVIECPKCGNYAEGSKSFFSNKKIKCSCGYIIDTKTEKLSSKECPHCGNMVVYDQTKGEKALCPVCHKQVNTRDSLNILVEFTCPSCSCKLSADKETKKYVCPLCDTIIDVQERIKKEEIKKQGTPSVIKYEGGNDVFVWKHPIEDFNLGSQLIVHESQEALFFSDGKALDLFVAGRYTLATKNLPLLENLYKLPSSANAVFHSEVYFVNLTTQMGIKWGTDSKVRLFDPASGLHVEIGACGNFNLRVCNSRKLILKLVGTANEFNQAEVNGLDVFGINFIAGKFKALVINKVKSNLARIIRENNINILIIDEYIDVISDNLKKIINETLENYGLTMPEFFITNILTPDDDSNFKKLKQQFADKTLLIRQEEIKKAEAEVAQSRKIIEAQTEAKLKMLGAEGDAEVIKIKAQAEADAYRMQAIAEAEEMKLKGYTYQQETTRKLGLEGIKNGITSNVNISNLDNWDCLECGTKNIKSKFCPECGAKKPEIISGWTCPNCGEKDIKSKFCPECGTKKPEIPTIWTCYNCGTKDIKSKFCPECGAKKLD